MWWDLIVAAPVPPPDSMTSEYSVPWTRKFASPIFAASSSKTRMNSAPIALRFVSGSLTPFSRARKRSSASTATSGTLKWSRNAATTCSPSFLRMRPWSTNTHVSWSPIARCTSSAATLESTPPLSPQMTLPPPTWARMRAICSETMLSGDHVRSASQISPRKRSRIVWP